MCHPSNYEDVFVTVALALSPDHATGELLEGCLNAWRNKFDARWEAKMAGQTEPEIHPELQTMSDWFDCNFIEQPKILDANWKDRSPWIGLQTMVAF